MLPAPPPVAVKVVLVPLQTVSVAGVIAGVKAATVTTALAVAVHWPPLDIVTVYVVVAVGATVIAAESLPLLQV